MYGFKFFFCVFMDRDEVELSSHLDRTGLVNKGLILLLEGPTSDETKTSEGLIIFILENDNITRRVTRKPNLYLLFAPNGGVEAVSGKELGTRSSPQI